MNTKIATAVPAVVAEGKDSRTVLKEKSAHELFFAVVGPVGAGSSHVARQLERKLLSTQFNGKHFTCKILKASNAIREWGIAHNEYDHALPSPIDEKERMQGLGDKMREKDNAEIAVSLAKEIAKTRAEMQGKPFNDGQPVDPDGEPRAYIIDSLKHPAEVNLLRRLYGDAFVLIGVVCSEGVRRERLLNNFFNGRERERPENKEKIENFMSRDANDSDHSSGQHVTDAFQEADFFVDNTPHLTAPDGNWEEVIDDELQGKFDRLISAITHKKIVRPFIAETAMHVAHSAKLRSSCLSRQVGAALIDEAGNIIAIGTNEVPKAGGGVYGEDQLRAVVENRCAFCATPHCSNNLHQNELISDALHALFGKDMSEEMKDEKLRVLRKTQLGGLLEFSRSVHAEMDALLSAARTGVPAVGTRLFVTTFPCHYCARHIVSAGVYEVQYIEPYPKSRALDLHRDAIETVPENWIPPRKTTYFDDVDTERQERHKAVAQGDALGAENPPLVGLKVGEVPAGAGKVLFRPFVGIAPKLYGRVFLKDREYKDKITGEFRMGDAEWGSSWSQHKVSYARLEADLAAKSAS